MVEQIKIEAPSDHFTLPVLGQDDKEIFMSFGLLSDLTTVVVDVDTLAHIHVVPEVRAEVLKVVLSERNERGEITVEHTAYTVPMIPHDAKALLNWIHQHVAAYFMHALQNMTETAGALQGVMEQMTSSLNITPDLTSETPAAAPSE